MRPALAIPVVVLIFLALAACTVSATPTATPLPKITPVVASPTPSPTAAAPAPLPPSAEPNLEDLVKILVISNQIPNCLTEGAQFGISVRSTFQGESQEKSVTFIWRRVPNSPDVEVLNVDQNRKFTLSPMQIASMTLTVNFVGEDGRVETKPLKTPLFRFTNLDGLGRACFDWVRINP